MLGDVCSLLHDWLFAMFVFNDTAPTEIYTYVHTLALHDALPIYWHRRLMIGATIVVLEPALGRLLPIPLMGVWAEPAVTLCQLAAVAIDRKSTRLNSSH